MVPCRDQFGCILTNNLPQEWGDLLQYRDEALDSESTIVERANPVRKE